jgi:hypothetical protein
MGETRGAVPSTARNDKNTEEQTCPYYKIYYDNFCNLTTKCSANLKAVSSLGLSFSSYRTNLLIPLIHLSS